MYQSRQHAGWVCLKWQQVPLSFPPNTNQHVFVVISPQRLLSTLLQGDPQIAALVLDVLADSRQIPGFLGRKPLDFTRWLAGKLLFFCPGWKSRAGISSPPDQCVRQKTPGSCVSGGTIPWTACRDLDVPNLLVLSTKSG